MFNIFCEELWGWKIDKHIKPILPKIEDRLFQKDMPATKWEQSECRQASHSKSQENGSKS